MAKVGEHGSGFRARRAFTLIELIVISALLLLMVAVMMPSLLHNIALEKRSRCLDNERAVGRAVVLYAGDQDDTLPMARYPDLATSPISAFFPSSKPSHGPMIWADVVSPYVKELSSFACPSDPTGLNSPKSRALSFALNAYFYRQPGVRRELLNGGALSEIVNASSKILLAEAANSARHEILEPSQWSDLDGSIWARHMGGANWIFGDLHTERHMLPVAWKAMDEAAWTPERAGTSGYPQWFPWQKSNAPTWN